MTDALEESVESEESLDDAIAAELAAQLDETPTEEPTEAPAEVSEETAQVTEEAPPLEEEKLSPHEHWKAEYKDGFSGMSRPQQDLWLQREKEFEQGYQQRGRELNQAKQFVNELHGIIEPVVNDWARQGLKPDAGIRRAIALEQALRDNPAETLISLAQERGVDLQQSWAQQPYEDPAIQEMRKQITELKREREQGQARQEEAQREDYARQHQAAMAQIAGMRDAKDESGNPKYPYIEHLVGNMTEALTSGRAQTLETAYDLAAQELRSHPLVKDVLAKSTREAADRSQAEADKAREASRTVDSNTTGTANQPKSLDDDILEAIEAHGGFD